MRIFVLLLLIITVSACTPPDRQDALKINIDYSDEDQRAVRDLENLRSTIDLLPYLDDSETTTRLLAAQALASVQDSAVIDQLGAKLKTDPSPAVRFHSAYALGQTYHPRAAQVLIESFGSQDTSAVNNEVRLAILEAVGKTGNEKNLDQIASVTTYGDQDNYLLTGQALAIYRFSLRQIVTLAGTQKMVQLACNSNLDPPIRLISANYLRRTRDLKLDTLPNALLKAYKDELEPDIRMSLVNPIIRLGDAQTVEAVIDNLRNESDYRVVINSLAAVDGTKFTVFSSFLDSLLEYGPAPLDLRAAQTMLDHAPLTERSKLLQLARLPVREPTRSMLYAATLRRTPTGFINTRNIIREEMQSRMDSTNNVYEHQGYLMALAEDPGNIELVIQMATEKNDTVFETFCAQAIQKMAESAKFELLYPSIVQRTEALENVIDYVKNILDKGNPGAMAIVSAIITNEKFGLRERVELRPLIRNAIRNLDLPAELETKQSLERSLAFLENRIYTPSPTEVKPIDWSLIERCTDSTYAVIRTNAGRIDVSLDFHLAPASVSNFMNLVETGYYNGKVFHRVVPNFVIQGGCPWGDGYGSLDYTIASELGPNYYNTPGKLGMASAGKDTEGVQWFITHSPTPHLDGKYTLFGQVISGMDVVHDIVQGDYIEDITLLNLRFQ